MTDNLSKRIIRCPSCKKSTRYDSSNTFRPFCSNRCKIQDIAQWATESYTLAEEGSGPLSEEDIEQVLRARQGDKED